MDQQALLNEQYEKHFLKIQRLRESNPGLSAPLLIKVPESYFTQAKKLMIVGQQTQGWDLKNIQDLLRNYEEFNFGESYYSTPFWNVIRKIESILGVDTFSIVWSNLNRCDFQRERPDEDLELELHECFPVLREEVEILEPDILLFFSGPDFDQHIYRSFPGCQLSPVPGFEERELARMEHRACPYHAYRTYHPKYLRMSGLESKVLEFVKAISA